MAESHRVAERDGCRWRVRNVTEDCREKMYSGCDLTWVERIAGASPGSAGTVSDHAALQSAGIRSPPRLTSFSLPASTLAEDRCNQINLLQHAWDAAAFISAGQTPTCT